MARCVCIVSQINRVIRRLLHPFGVDNIVLRAVHGLRGAAKRLASPVATVHHLFEVEHWIVAC